MRACRAVGQYMGIEVRAPHRIGDEAPGASREPLGDLARASGFHVRPVTLHEGWWRGAAANRCWDSSMAKAPNAVALVPARPRLGRLSRPMSSMIPDGLIRPVDPGARRPHRSRRPGSSTGRSPTIASASPTSSASAAASRAWARELAMVLVMALRGRAPRPGDPHRLGHPRRPGDPPGRRSADRPRGSSVLFPVLILAATAVFQAIQRLLVLRIEGRISATLIPAVWERLLRLPSRFFAGFASGDLALRAMGSAEVFKRVSGAVVDQHRHGRLLALQPGPAL